MYRAITLALFLVSQPAASVTLLVDDRFTGFTASGLAPGGGGPLDSNLWAIAGASAGDTAFGETRGDADFARGVSSGGVGTGGVYAFLLPGDAAGIGVQATGSDFTPGRITRRVVNDTGSAVDGLALAFDLWFLNNGARSTRTGFAVARTQGAPWAPVAGLEIDTPGAADALGWQRWSASAPLPPGALDAGSSLLVGWYFDDLAGGGSRDELALAGLRVTASSSPAVTLASPATATLSLLALGGAALRRRAARTRVHAAAS